MNSIKKLGKNLLCLILEHQAQNLRKKHTFTVVAVVGSVGKTSTKLAIATVLSSLQRVRYQEGNYNDRLTVPLVLFGHTSPSIFNMVGWAKIILSNQKQINTPFEFDAVVLELGTDGPGQIKEFTYLHPDIAVVTAVTPEHMEFFKDIKSVAEEELSAASFSGKTLINIDDVAPQYLNTLHGYTTYGVDNKADYKASIKTIDKNGRQELIISSPQNKNIDTRINLLGKQGAKVALAAAAVALEVGLDGASIMTSLSKLTAFSGRMNVLPGIKGSIIIDDSYNSSPAAVKAALDVLYAMNAEQKIAILGTMNELGTTSVELHKQIGAYCDGKKLDLLVTIGKDAETYTAPVAITNGCTVASFDSPYDAGNYVKSVLKPEAIILAKGSQNRVFAEESLKVLLVDSTDENKLVRQSPYWLNIKNQQFGKKA